MGAKSYSTAELYRQHTVTDSVRTTMATIKRTGAFSRTGTNNPKWRVLVKAGLNASNTMDVTVRNCTIRVPSSYVSYVNFVPPDWAGNDTFDERNDLCSLFDNVEITSHFEGLLPEASSRATSALYRTIRDYDHQFQGGVFFGEFGKTVRMVAGAAGNFRKNVLSYLTGARALAKRKGTRNGNIQSAYLEAVFGWQPLIGDIKDAAIAVARARLNLPRIRFRARGLAEKHYPLGMQTIDAIGRFNVFDLKTTKSEVIYYGAFKVSDKGLPVRSPAERIISLSGFDLRSFVPTAWELIPYSFLIDYFVNIGELLEAACTDTSLVAWLTKVERHTSRSEVQVVWKGPSVAQFNQYNQINGQRRYGAISGTSGGCSRFLSTISRRGNQVMPMLAPRFKLAELDAKKFFNIGALLTR
jgi:hypothetical protein